MPGIGTTLNEIRNDLRIASSRNRERFDDLDRRLEEVERRLDNLDKPAQTTRAPSKRAGKKRAASRREDLPVPVPDRPEAMKDAEVGKDPR